MSDLKLTKTRMLAGVWEGILDGVQGDAAPELMLSHRGETLDPPKVEKDGNTWYVRVPVPINHLSDGALVFLICDAEGEKLTDFTLIAGEALADDIRAEMELLREELDMLKRAFRRHCLETIDQGS